MGIIPAHAGKTFGVSLVKNRIWDHPRSRGENSALRATRVKKEGSSPLTRGKLTIAWVVSRIFGIIPAHAGKTVIGELVNGALGDHPRSRGENPKCCRPCSQRVGSSPLTRGKLDRRCRRPRRPGIIPAHAGKTSGRSRRKSLGRDHPRSRGENVVPSTGSTIYVGSSPLTRGKQAWSRNLLSLGGIIPAHAGKTSPGAHRP